MMQSNSTANELIGNALYSVFIITLIFAFSPFKIVAYAGSTGDFTIGTINSPLISSLSFSNSMFAIALASLTLAVLSRASKGLMT